MVDRSVGKPAAPTSELSARQKKESKRSKVGSQRHDLPGMPEAVKEVIEVTEFNLWLAIDMHWPIRLSARHESEPIRDANG